MFGSITSSRQDKEKKSSIVVIKSISRNFFIRFFRWTANFSIGYYEIEKIISTPVLGD
ncbi:MAG: hypothetical protein HKP17_04450 [Ignavibacteriaceae bacterium]|nr:hypothetical protein [Ignavibacteriaceae bacterium]